MFDMHHDLLSIMYYSRYILNDCSFLNKWLKDFNSDNVSGLLANLYFMNKEEMAFEIGDDREIDVVKMFKISDQPITRYNKNMDNMKENRKVLQLSLQYSNEEVVKD